jgi:hypothetical protein
MPQPASGSTAATKQAVSVPTPGRAREPRETTDSRTGTAAKCHQRVPNLYATSRAPVGTQPAHSRSNRCYGLCTAYVIGCAFRSVLPQADVQRICLFDTWLSSILVGRSVATVAELCFAVQWAIVLREVGRLAAIAERGKRRIDHRFHLKARPQSPSGAMWRQACSAPMKERFGLCKTPFA